MNTAFVHRFTHFLLAFLLVSNPLLISFYPLLPAPVSAATEPSAAPSRGELVATPETQQVEQAQEVTAKSGELVATPEAQQVEQPQEVTARSGGLIGTPDASAVLSGNDITITDSAFAPNRITVVVGAEVTWVNAGSVSHQVRSGTPPVVNSNTLYLPLIVGGINLTSALNGSKMATPEPTAGTNTPNRHPNRKAAGPGWDSGVLAPGQTFTHSFSTVGTYNYYDPLHTQMSGQVIVVPTDPSDDGPMIEIHAPRDRQSVYTQQPTIEITYSDFDSSVNSASLVVQLAPENGTEADITSDLTVTESGAQGTVSTALADDTTYTLSVSLADDAGHTSRTSISFYIPPNPEDITPPDAPEDAGWVSGVIYDSATCNEHLTTCQGVAGVEVTMELVNTQALAQVRAAREQEIEARWMANRSRFTPLDPMRETNFTTPISGTIITGPDGFFAFPVTETGHYWLRAEKEGYTYGQREADVVLERSTATNSIYLTQLDSAVTPCDNKGCLHTSSDGLLQVEIPAGAIPTGETVDVTATNFEQVEYLPSGDLPEGTWETYAFNLGGDSEYQFRRGTQATIRIKNTRGFAPGTSIPLGYWNQATQDWEHAGTGIVDATGEWIETGVTHFSNYDCNDPIAPPGDLGDGSGDNSGGGSGGGGGSGNGGGGGGGGGDDPPPPDPTPTPTEEPCDKEGGCVIDLKTGTLGEDITLPAVNVLGEATAPTLLYNTNRANPSEIIDIALTLDPDPDVELGNYIGFELYIEGQAIDQFFFSATLQSGETGRYRYMWDARDAQGNLLPPGVYKYEVKLSVPYRAQYCYALNGIFGNPPDCENGATGVFTDAVEEFWTRGTIELESHPAGPFGSGWVLEEQQRLYEDEAGRILIADGQRNDEFYFPGKDLLSDNSDNSLLTQQTSDNILAWVNTESGSLQTITETLLLEQEWINTTIDVGNDPYDIVLSSEGNLAYVTNPTDDSMSIVDLENQQVVAPIAVGNSPYGIALSPNEDFAYVTNRYDNTVSVVDLTSQQEVAVINVGNEPHAIVLSPDGTFAYVTNIFDRTLSVIDLETQQQVAVINIQSTTPWDVVLSPDGTLAYVTTYSSVSVVDLETQEQVATINISTEPNIMSPASIALSSDGTLAYITNGGEENGIVSVVELATQQEISTFGNWNNPYNIALSSDGTLAYVISSAGLSIVELATQKEINTIGVETWWWPYVWGIALSPDGTLAYLPSNQLFVIDLTKQSKLTTIDVGEQPAEVALSSDGAFAYVTNYFDDHLSVIDINTQQQVALVDVGTQPRSVALSSDGALAYVTNQGDATVSVVDLTTNQQLTVINVGNAPYDITSYGNFAYVTNRGDDTVSVVELASWQEVAVIDVGHNPEGIAVSPDGAFAYVVNNYSGNLSVIDLAIQKEVATINLENSGRLPSRIMLSQDGTMAYVTNLSQIKYTGNVSVVDLENQQTVTSIPMEERPEPSSIALSSDGAFAYVSWGNNTKYTVLVVDLATYQIVNRIYTEKGPSGLAVSGTSSTPVGPLIYSRTETDYSTLTYDPVSATYTRTYPDGTEVHFNSDGTHDYTLFPDGRKTIYTYHSDGAVATMGIIPPGEETAPWIWTFNYTSGQLDSMTDPAGRVTDVTVNAHGHLSEVKYPDDSTRRFVYDQRGLLTQQVDENGDVSTYAYDDYGRLTTHTAPPHAVYDPETGESEMVSVVRHFTNSDTSYPLINDSVRGDPGNPAPPVPRSDELVVGVEYGRGQRSGQTNKWGAFLSHTDSLGRTITYERDEANNVTRRTAPDGDCIEYTYDDLGNVVSETRLDASQCGLSLAARDPSQSQTWTYTYSERFNRIKTATNPLGNTTTYFYDYEDASAVGEAGKLIRVEYPPVEDESGQVVTPTVSLTYNQWGLIETQTDMRGTVTKYVYTEGTPDEASDGSNPLFAPGVTPVLGLLTQIIEDFGGENITTIYRDFDAAGNPQSQLDPRGNPTLYTYDALNRMLTEEDALAYVNKYEYDGQGNIIKMIRDYTVSTTGRNIVTTYTYNSYDQLLSERTVADGLVRERTNRHDINRQVVVSTDYDGNTSIYSYDPSNQLIAETDPLGHTTAYTYTLKGQLATVTYADGSVANYTYDAFGRRVQEVVDAEALQLTTSLTYDANNNLLTMTDPAGTVTCYTYDVLNRMSTQTQDCGQLDLTTTYTYDLAGNRTRIVDPRGVATHLEYDALNRTILERRDDGGLNLESTYQYNEVSAQLSVTDPRGIVTSNEYDALNRLIAQTQDAGTNGLNLTSSFTYNRLGDQATQTDANGDTTTYEYNAFGELISQTDPLGHVTSYTYNNIGYQIAETDPNGQITEYTYDPNGRRTSVTNPLGDSASYVYDALGRRTQHINANGGITQYEYDGVGRLTREINPLGETTTSQYDGAGRLTQRTDPLGHTTTYEYDGVGRLISETDPLGQKSVYNYDANGNRTSMTTAIPKGGTIADGQTTSYTYDAVGRKRSETNPLGHTTTSTYNANGNLASVSDANGNTTTFTNDALGRMLQTTNPLNNTMSQTYDKAGRLASITNANGDTISYTYDAAGRQTGVTYPNGTRITRTYDPAGRLLMVVGPNTNLSFTYDAIGRVLQITDNRLNHSVSYTYDAVGNRLTLSGPTGIVTSYEYDAAHRLSQVGRGSQVFSMTYNAVGRILQKTLPNNAVTSYNYDNLNRLTTLTYQQADGTVIDRLTYELDAANNRTSVTFQNGDTIQYTYDKANQLIEEVRTGDLAYNQTFSYDSVGNRTQSTNDGTTTNYTYNAANQLTQESGPQSINYTYNARGDLIMRSGGGEDFTYSYDYDGRLTGVNGPNVEAVNEYDAFNRRVAQTVNGVQTNFAYNGTEIGATVLAEYDADMTPLTAYTLAPNVDGRLGRTTDGTTAYYLQDGLTSTRYMLGSDGQVLSSYDYDGYGQLTASTGNVAESYLFTNRRWDEAANLYYNRARYYTPSAGRFTQADPLGFVEGANLYRYVRNNPINRVDPLGLYSESCHKTTRNIPFPRIELENKPLMPFAKVTADVGGSVKLITERCERCCDQGPYKGQVRNVDIYSFNVVLDIQAKGRLSYPNPILSRFLAIELYGRGSYTASYQYTRNGCKDSDNDHYFTVCNKLDLVIGLRGGLISEFKTFKADLFVYGELAGGCQLCMKFNLDQYKESALTGCKVCGELGVHVEVAISDFIDPRSYDWVIHRGCKTWNREAFG